MEVDEPVSVRTGISVGLGAAGVAALVTSWFLSDLAEPVPGPLWTTIGTVAVAIALVAVLRTRSPKAAVVAALLGLAVSALAGFGFTDQYDRGFPGAASVIAAAGGLAVTAAALTALRFRPEHGWRPGPVSAASAAFLLVPAVAAPVALSVPDLPVEATTATVVEVPAVPASVSKVVWSTEVDGKVHDVVPAGAGVAVLLDDAVVALDGVTGEVRWRRARPGSEAVWIDASPDGATVVTEFRPPGGPVLRREVIDALTGEVRFAADHEHLDLDDRLSSFGTDIRLTDTSQVEITMDGFTGHSLTDGARLWHHAVPDGCRMDPGWRAHFTIGAGVLVPLSCGDEFRYRLLDATTGDVRWEHVIETPEGTLEVGALLASDRALVAVFAHVADDQGVYEVLDVTTGDALPFTGRVERLLAGGFAVARDQVVDVTTGDTVTGDDAFLECARRPQSTHLASGLACVDPAIQTNADYDRVAETSRMGVAVGTYAALDLAVLPVRLGSSATMASFEFTLVPAPGAVVASNLAEPEPGKKVRLVGLR